MSIASEQGQVVAYTCTHTQKHTLNNSFSQLHSSPIVHDSIAGLYALRNHPLFYSYGGSRQSLADLIEFNLSTSEIESAFAFGKEDRVSYASLAMPYVQIPDATGEFTRGILTDVVKATKKRVLSEGRLVDDEEKYRMYVERTGLNVSREELRKIFADKHAYATFIIGYCLPKLEDGTKYIESMLDWNNRLKDPKGHIEQLIERKL